MHDHDDIYHLMISKIQRDDGRTVLTAKIARNFDTGRIDILNASVDCEESGSLTHHGLNAYRCLCMAELILAKAMNLKTPDPQEEIAALKKINGELRTKLEAFTAAAP